MCFVESILWVAGNARVTAAVPLEAVIKGLKRNLVPQGKSLIMSVMSMTSTSMRSEHTLDFSSSHIPLSTNVFEHNFLGAGQSETCLLSSFLFCLRLL